MVKCEKVNKSEAKANPIKFPKISTQNSNKNPESFPFRLIHKKLFSLSLLSPMSGGGTWIVQIGGGSSEFAEWPLASADDENAHDEEIASE